MTRDVLEETCKIYDMRPLCRKNNDNKDKECAQGNLPVQWEGKKKVENIDILRRMKCNNRYWYCPELYNIFFYVTGDLQKVDNLPGQEGKVEAMYGSSGVVLNENGVGGDSSASGAQYIAKEDQPLYVVCVQEAGMFFSCHLEIK